ncbi:MAG: hypothetical protein IT290_06410 [Deltaproteobacteria bacterium]|nr:hypothetical protein [Deltaproteobacteria bacterium]
MALILPALSLAAEPATPKRCVYAEDVEANTTHTIGALRVKTPNCLEPIPRKLLREVAPERLIDSLLQLSEVGLPLTPYEVGGGSGVTLIVRVTPVDQYHGVGPLPESSDPSRWEATRIELMEGLSAAAQIGDLPRPEMSREYLRLFEIREGQFVHVFDFRFTINGYNAECWKQGREHCDGDPTLDDAHQPDKLIQHIMSSLQRDTVP